MKALTDHVKNVRDRRKNLVIPDVLWYTVNIVKRH